ncbi:MAG: hypothetical protein M2R45_05395 [Verrucomicrobia subdivision 3 bacterium]|nr:hypothetical protein [Limisphaerales bacterium]MCS1417851.1 hypothetical protein [Limisphaerales bacterium]
MLSNRITDNALFRNTFPVAIFKSVYQETPLPLASDADLPKILNRVSRPHKPVSRAAFKRASKSANILSSGITLRQVTKRLCSDRSDLIVLVS